jgi:hypothetical protein
MKTIYYLELDHEILGPAYATQELAEKANKRSNMNCIVKMLFVLETEEEVKINNL